ncbi:hypothetical protein SASPL_143143 [Salvia splendens]|uniref:Pentatricopeptide repeat domain-containing protein 1 n=1 Tax=Salvia splendens TaxID=180675 RepID=A0A8X8WL88_SALSN|nr:hypothetical protein SASPL_143143 [Salvia splendens]
MSLPNIASKVHNIKTLNTPSSNFPFLVPDPVTITNLLLQSNNPESLAQCINSVSPWTPGLVQAILKRLWNHGPKALQFFKLVEDHPSYAHSAIAFDHAIDISARIRDYKTMWTLECKMRSMRLGPSPKTFAIMMERYVSAGKADKAVKIFLSMHEHGCQQDLKSFNALLDVLCKSKRAEMAYGLLKQTPRALEVMREMVERGVEPTLTTYNILLKGYFRAGQIKEGWEFFLEMKKRKIEIDVVTYTTVIHGFGVAGEVEKSRKVFDEMIGAGVLPSVATYTALIQVLCKKDSVEKAIVVFEDMLMKDDCEPTIQTYNVVIRYCCEDGKLERALEIFGKMNGGSCLPNLDTYNILIGSMFVRKKSDDLLVAGKLLIEMVDRGFMPRRLTFNRVLNGLMLTGNQGFAQEILRLQSTCGRLPRHFRL